MTTSNLSYLCPGCFAEKGATSQCTHCGYDEQAPRGTLPLAHRTVLDQQFLIGRVLGKPGGFGITYLAWDLRLETRVAVKEYLPRDLAGREANHTTVAAHTGDDVELFRYGLEQFVQEARTLAQLNHPNIVRARHFFEANGTAYLVMDYYDGLSLAEYLEQQGDKLPEQAAVQLMLPVLDGLRAVHEKGFLHRDIKPQNIYLAKTDTGGTRPILLDFGAARQAMGERSRSLSVLVSAGYAPFEQYQRKGKQGPWSDIYSAAAVLYRAVTGIEPLEANERIPDDNLRPAATLGVNLALSDALQGALAFSPSERPATVQAFQAQLLGDAQPQPTRPARPTAPESATESPKSLNNSSGFRVLIGLAMLIAILAGAGGAWVLLAPETLSDIIGTAMSGRSNATAVSEREGDAQQAELARERAADEARESKLREERAAKAEEQRLERQREQRAAEQAKRLALATCREHMENRRYTYPDDANALLCYRKILKTAPDNAEAKEALTFMTAFYVDSAKQALRSGDRERVQDRIARMRLIAPDSQDATRIEDLLQKSEVTTASVKGTLISANMGMKTGTLILKTQQGLREFNLAVSLTEFIGAKWCSGSICKPGGRVLVEYNPMPRYGVIDAIKVVFY